MKMQREATKAKSCLPKRPLALMPEVIGFAR
jgi:hypothetical protein